MTIFDTCKEKLEAHPQFRERRFRGVGLAKLALRDLGLEGKFENGERLGFDEIISFAGKFDSYRHEYDAVQRAFPSLQGEDYSDGKALAQAKQIEYGYESGYHKLSALKV